VVNKTIYGGERHGSVWKHSPPFAEGLICRVSPIARSPQTENHDPGGGSIRNKTAPNAGRRMQPSIDSRVDFPEPESPIINAISPGGTEKDTLSTAATAIDPCR